MMKRVSAAEVDLEVRIPVERPHTTRMGRDRIVAVSLRKAARPSNSFIRPGPREEKLRESDFVEKVNDLLVRRFAELRCVRRLNGECC